MRSEAEELRKLAKLKLQEARKEKDKKKKIQLLREARQSSLEAQVLEIPTDGRSNFSNPNR